MADPEGPPGTEATPKGGNKKKERLYLVGGVLALLVLILYLRHRSANAAQPATSTPAIDPNTGLPYGYGMPSGYVDPNTGLPYGYGQPPVGGSGGGPTTGAGGPGVTGGSSSGGSTGGPSPSSTGTDPGQPTPTTGGSSAPSIMLAMPTNQPTGQYTNATLASGPYGAGGQTVAWPSWFGQGAQGAALASQFQAMEAQNARTTPAQQQAVLAQAAHDPALAHYLAAVHAAGY